jgi:hypothetical protein
LHRQKLKTKPMASLGPADGQDQGPVPSCQPPQGFSQWGRRAGGGFGEESSVAQPAVNSPSPATEVGLETTGLTSL